MLIPYTHTHTHTHARTQIDTRPHVRTHARTQIDTHRCTHAPPSAPAVPLRSREPPTPHTPAGVAAVAGVMQLRTRGRVSSRPALDPLAGLKRRRHLSKPWHAPRARVHPARPHLHSPAPVPACTRSGRTRWWTSPSRPPRVPPRQPAAAPAPRQPAGGGRVP